MIATVVASAITVELKNERPMLTTSATLVYASRLGLAGSQTGGTCIVSCGVLRLVSTIQASGNAATTAIAMMTTVSTTDTAVRRCCGCASGRVAAAATIVM